MPSFKAVFPSKYLRADDIGTKRPVVTIETAVVEQIGSGSNAEEKLVVEFVEASMKKLVLPKINCETIAEIADTDDYSQWPGTRIQLYTTKVEFQGRRVLAIRVCAPPATAAKPNDSDVPF